MKQPIRTVLVDDEKNSREVLTRLLEKKHPEIELVGQADNVDEAYELCCRLQPQLVFLDIQMPRENGFNLLKKFDELPFEVIFITGYDQYAITAIKFHALDYLLKPVDVDELAAAIQKVNQQLESKTNRQPQVINFLQSLTAQDEEQKFAVHSGEKVKLIQASEVLTIRADGRYAHLTLIGGEHHVMSKNLKEFEDYFGDPSDFIRISKTHIINTRHIKEYFKGEPFIIRMVNDERYEVARRKKSEVLSRLRRNSF